ncbi:MAG TPA: Gfo/Idh/MocA family oxidoreductase [Hellea balneolensis]|uniref:Gfo/Idh/MocA family oxidoreductase n=1 Tax=Hellea balneolensis TaxID=287478 RepID=A0A7C3CC17_9PROT|nr:Gfo/Idh/MocA family oxidoreductase [Hellea balneolensis]
MNKDSLKIGVIGAGVFGGYHASKCAAHPRHDFIGIFDPTHDRVRAMAKKYETRAFDNCNMLLAGVDAVIVACPAVHHGPIAIAALRAGRHVLVEKPVAADLESATTMVRIAEEENLVLQVGHQERFVARAIGLDKTPERPMSIKAKRFGPKAVRGTDVSVTLDLMVHDLDMAMWLMDSRPDTIRGESIKVYSEHPDAARACLMWNGVCKVELEASRCEDKPERVMELEYPSGSVRVDFVNKTFKDTTGFGLNKEFARHVFSVDSLGAATDAFTASILDGEPVMVPGSAGRDALEMALKIDGRLHSEIR